MHNQLFRVISACGCKRQGAGNLNAQTNASGQKKSLLSSLSIAFMACCVRGQ